MFIRFLGNIINTDQIVSVRYSTSDPKKGPTVVLTLSHGELWANGDGAVELMAFLCNCCQKHIGPDLSLFKATEVQP